LIILSDYISFSVFNKLRDTRHVGIVYFVFKISDKDQTASNVLRVLLRQLLEEFDGLPDSVYTAYTTAIREKRGPPDLLTSTNLFKSCATHFVKTHSSPVLVLLDAFDEFKNKGDENNQRTYLRKSLESLATVLGPGKVRFLITTRVQYRDELARQFRGIRIEVKPDPMDVDKYLDRRLENSSLTDSLKKSIKSKIKEKPPVS
jgi:hypothetical protein